MNWKHLAACAALAAALAGDALAQSSKDYSADFEQAEIGSVPDDFLVLDGGFAVAEFDGGKVLELPGAPLESFGVLFGANARENVEVSARIHATAKGRRFPTFAVGLNGVAGFKFRASPAKKALELYRSDDVKATKPLDWDSGKWTHLKLRVVKVSDSEWRVEGRFWQEGQAEPAEPTLVHVETTSPPNGRASILGSPFSGTPIRYDDLKVVELK